MDTHKRQLDRELSDLKGSLIGMAELAEQVVDRAVEELASRNRSLADGIPQQEEKINRLQIAIDDKALTLLATRQPVANDLRAIVAAMKINAELERIGDLAVNISTKVDFLLTVPPLKPLIDIPRMADLARGMVRDSVKAFQSGDILLAQTVRMTDDKVDDLRDQVLRELFTYMIADPQSIERAMALMLIAQTLERVGDHATNIAEDVIYMVKGQDVRHPQIPR
ncbi:MAG: phosphate signaling complex protein PhoU [Planctomycetaceae bacterium]|nr:phosphate signaling complex protein PhoU [Planctomycetaceae bacterium]